MKEIKFRYIFKNKNFNDISIYYLTLKDIEKGNVKKIFESGMLENGYELIARNQYIGLKSKNGKEIYEGDVVKYVERSESFPELTETHYHVIEFDKINTGYLPFCNVEFYGGDFAKEVEIIGNISENPELINDVQ